MRGLVQGKQMGCLGGWRVPPHGAGAGCPADEVWLWGRRRSPRWRCAVLVWGLMAVSVAVVLLVRNFPTTLDSSLDPSKGALGLLRKIDGGKVGWISKPMCDLITPVMTEIVVKKPSAACGSCKLQTLDKLLHKSFGHR